MKLRMSVMLVAASVLCTFAAQGADGYRCSVVSALELGSSGQMEPFALTTFYEGKEFVIDKATGRITGNSISNANAFGQPKVLDFGSGQQSFKALTVFQPNISVDYLLVRTFEDGPKKPFLFLSSGTLLSGTCVDY